MRKRERRGVERRESSGSLCPHYSRVATQASMQAWSNLSLHRPTCGMCVCVFVCRHPHVHVHVRIMHMGHAHTRTYVRICAYNVRDTCNILFAELLFVT